MPDTQTFSDEERRVITEVLSMVNMHTSKPEFLLKVLSSIMHNQITKEAGKHSRRNTLIACSKAMSYALTDTYLETSGIPVEDIIDRRDAYRNMPDHVEVMGSVIVEAKRICHLTAVGALARKAVEQMDHSDELTPYMKQEVAEQCSMFANHEFMAVKDDAWTSTDEGCVLFRKILGGDCGMKDLRKFNMKPVIKEMKESLEKAVSSAKKARKIAGGDSMPEEVRKLFEEWDFSDMGEPETRSSDE